MKNLFLFLISLFICNISFANNAQNIRNFKDNLTVCSEPGFLPFEMKDNSGHWSGFDIDLIKKFTDENNMNLNMIDISLDGLIPALTTKKCDLIASGLTMTEERAHVVLFSKPVYSVIISAAFLDSPENKNKYKNFHDIDKAGVKIASQTGSAATLFLKKIISKATLMQYTSENDEVNAILQKKNDLFVDDNIFISQVEKKLNKKFYIITSSQKGDLAFAARKEDIILISKINAFIDKTKKKGEYQALTDKYF